MHIESTGNTSDILDRDVAFASFNGTDVRVMKFATLGKLRTTHIEPESLCSNDIAQVSLKKCRVHVEFAPCPTGVKGSTAFR